MTPKSILDYKDLFIKYPRFVQTTVCGGNSHHAQFVGTYIVDETKKELNLTPLPKWLSSTSSSLTINPSRFEIDLEA